MAVDIGISNPEIIPLDTLLRKGCFEVPFFQREYSWSKDFWIDLFGDICRSMEKNRGHFFGFMTLKKGNEVDFEIVEGQQRLSTVTIFLCVMRDLCAELNINDLKEDIDRSFIYTGGIFTIAHVKNYKLTLSRINRDFFKQYIQTYSPLVDKEKSYKKESHVDPSNKLIYDCYKYFYQQLSDGVKGLALPEKKEKLKSFGAILLNNFFVATTQVNDHLVAYNMFQTINDRGLDLALSDLLKLHLCTKVSKEAKFIEDYWEAVRTQLVSSNMNNFLRHYWLSSRAAIQETRLLEELQDEIKDEKAAYDFMGELSDEVETYEALVKPSNDFWDRRDKDLINLLRDIQILSATIPLPLFMSAASKLDTKELKKVIKLITVFIFRYLTIGEQESKALEKIFSDLAINIRKNKITESSQIREELLRHDITNEQFLSTLANKDIKLNKVAKYILENIEKHLDPDQEKFSENITLEHILPKTADAEVETYMQENGMDHSSLVNKLGNQTLLLGKVNKSVRNVIFSKKSKEYKKSSKLKLNQGLSDLQSWTEKDIMKRQKLLAKYCIEIWKL